MITRTLHATLIGRAWGGFEATLPLCVTLRSNSKLAPTLQKLLRDKGGDFQDCLFSGESFIELTSTRPSRRGETTRSVYIALEELPSVAHLIHNP